MWRPKVYWTTTLHQNATWCAQCQIRKVLLTVRKKYKLYQFYFSYYFSILRNIHRLKCYLKSALLFFWKVHVIFSALAPLQSCSYNEAEASSQRWLAANRSYSVYAPVLTQGRQPVTASQSQPNDSPDRRQVVRPSAGPTPKWFGWFITGLDE